MKVLKSVISAVASIQKGLQSIAIKNLVLLRIMSQ